MLASSSLRAASAALRTRAATCAVRLASTAELEEKVLAQYNTDGAMTFYKTVMGGGDGGIHYGIYKDPETEGVKEAAQNIVNFLGDLMELNVKPTNMMDLGSGHGSAAISNAARFGCNVTGFNLCPHQNELTEAVAHERGVGHLISTAVGNFDEGLPAEWTGKFDAVWSEEVLCHSREKAFVISEVSRCLSPGGVFAFTDIMAGEGATAEQVKTFTDRNATTTMARPSDYLKWTADAGLKYAAYVDLTDHLPTFFAHMIRQIDTHYEEMRAEGVKPEYMDNFRQSLSDRIPAAREGAFAWGAFVCVKATDTAKVSGAVTAAVRGTTAEVGAGISTTPISGST